MRTHFTALTIIAIGATSLASAHSALATTINIGKPYNVLSGATAVSSTSTGGFPASAAVDDLVRAVPPADQDHGLIFTSFDSNQRLGLSGSFGLMRKLLIWTIPAASDERIPNSATIRSSLNSLSGAALINAANFETSLGTFPLGIAAFTGTAAGTDNTYATLLIGPPAGTQSLYLSFGAADFKAERITEVQAFIPEPSTILLVGLALLALVGLRR